MSNWIRVSAPRMDTDSQEMAELINMIPKRMEELKIAMDRLSSGWKGVAHDAFCVQVASDMEYMADFYRLLNDYNISFQESRKKYIECEQKTYSMSKDIRV